MTATWRSLRTVTKHLLRLGFNYPLGWPLRLGLPDVVQESRSLQWAPCFGKVSIIFSPALLLFCFGGILRGGKGGLFNTRYLQGFFLAVLFLSHSPPLMYS